MITDKITVYGEKENALNICGLLTKCTEDFDVPDVHLDVYLWDSEKEISASDKEKIAVIPFEERESVPKGVKFVTYSDTDSRADVSALNVQKRESALCFEILSTAFMSRVFIPYTEKYTLQQVLVCASVLFALGMPAAQAVSLINETLK